MSTVIAALRVKHPCRLLLAIALVVGTAPVAAQDMDHSGMGHDPPSAEPTQAVEHSAMDHAGMDHAAMDHAAMGHAAIGQTMPMDDATADPDLPAAAPPLEPIPPVTPADRAAAFQDLDGHALHGTSVHWFALLDRLETPDENEGNALAWEGSGWAGTDLERMWVRSEGEAFDGSIESASVEVLYGRAIAPWWDALVGLRHDFGDDPSQTFAAVGLVGLVPYMFEVEATAYLGESGQAGLGLEAEHETLITNRLILQSAAEAELWSKDDPRRGIASGLGKVEAGLRLRYEFTRKVAPYIGVMRERLYGGTADLRRAQGGDIDDTRIVVGLRTWF